MKKALAVLLCLIFIASASAVTTGALTLEEAYSGYYLVGTFTDWSIDSAYRLYQDPADIDEYVIESFALTTSDAFKVVYSRDGMRIDEYFPAGVGNNCTLAAQDVFTDAIVNIRFRPDMDGSDGWYYGCINLEMKSVKPTESTKPKPTESQAEKDGGYYIVFKNDDLRIRECNRLLGPDFIGHYCAYDITLATYTPFKIAYSQDLENVTALYPEDEDVYYTPRYNSCFYYLEFAPLGDGGIDGDDEWFMGYIKAFPCEPPELEASEIGSNRYEDKFTEFLPDWCEQYTYDELYYHGSSYDPDWVLVKTESKDPIDGWGYGVFDEYVVFSGESLPFNFGYGVYDRNADTFYTNIPLNALTNLLAGYFTEQGGRRRQAGACHSGTPTRPARWGEEEPRHEVKAYLPDMPFEYSVRRRQHSYAEYNAINVKVF